MAKYGTLNDRECAACGRVHAPSSAPDICRTCERLSALQRRAHRYLEWQGKKTPKEAEVNLVTGWMLALDAR